MGFKYFPIQHQSTSPHHLLCTPQVQYHSCSPNNLWPPHKCVNSCWPEMQPEIMIAMSRGILTEDRFGYTTQSVVFHRRENQVNNRNVEIRGARWCPSERAGWACLLDYSWQPPSDCLVTPRTAQAFNSDTKGSDSHAVLSTIKHTDGMRVVIMCATIKTPSWSKWPGFRKYLK